MDNNIRDYKVIIISGNNDKYGDIDGEVHYVGPINQYDFHIDCLLAYADKKYPNVPIFKKITSRCEPNVPIYFLTCLNNVVYINISDNRIGNYGMLFLPDEISQKQENEIYNLANKIENAHVDIIYDMDFDDGLVIWNEFEHKRPLTFKKMLDQFFKMQKQKKPKN